MVNNLSETEILNYLMTSEFDEGLTPEEFKLLLFKFRNFYRVVSCSISNHKERMEMALQEVQNIKNQCDVKISESETEKLQTQEKFNKLANKRLTWKERFKGKIILEDEN